jgi:hypothetical protein
MLRLFACHMKVMHSEMGAKLERIFLKRSLFYKRISLITEAGKNFCELVLLLLFYIKWLPYFSS